MTLRLLEGLTFKVADGRERVLALELRERIYAAELGNAGLDSFDDVAVHLVAATEAGQVVAALRLVRPEHRPFDLEHYVDLSSMLGADRRPAEVSRFCVEPARRQIHRTQMVHLGILKLLYEYAVKHQITDVVTLGLPHLQNVYRAALFEALGAACEHPIWGTAHLMRLNIADLRANGALSRHPVGRLLTHGSLPNVIV